MRKALTNTRLTKTALTKPYILLQPKRVMPSAAGHRFCAYLCLLPKPQSAQSPSIGSHPTRQTAATERGCKWLLLSVLYSFFYSRLCKLLINKLLRSMETAQGFSRLRAGEYVNSKKRFEQISCTRLGIIIVNTIGYPHFAFW